MKKVMQLMMLSCARATFYIEKEQLTSLSFIERIKLRWHLKMCDKCRLYSKQSPILSRALKAHKDFSKINLEGLALSESAKARIISKINQN